MLMIHDPKLYPRSPRATPNYQYYEFNDRNIREVMYENSDTGPDRIPLHLGNFVRDYIEKNHRPEQLKAFDRDDYTEAERMIQVALNAYSSLTPLQRTKLHEKELNRLRRQLRLEYEWAIY